MTELLARLRTIGALDPPQIEAALRRQMIYGGSLDTVLLELELIGPAELDRALAAAAGVPSVPLELLEPARERPSGAVPRELVDLGWAMPLAQRDGKLQVAIHPELSDERLTLLRKSVPGVEAMVTAECCLAKLASERTGSLVPQRYAILVVSYLAALRNAATAPARTTRAPEASVAPPPVAVPAPWMRTPEVAVAPRRQTQLGFQVPPTLELGGAQARESERTGPVFTPPPRAWEAAPNLIAADSTRTATLAPTVPPPPTAAAAPGTHPVSLEPLAPTPTTVRTGATSIMTPASLVKPALRPLRERISGLRGELAAASFRDTITEALVRAAMEISPRAGLFGIKKEGLRGLAGPGSIVELADRIVPISEGLQAIIDGTRPCERVSDFELRTAVRQSGASPCVFVPVRVGGRAVLALYLDRDGAPLDHEERAVLGELCELAGARLEEVLRQMRAATTTSAPSAATVAAPGASTTAPPAVATVAASAEGPRPIELTSRIDVAPAPREPAIPNLPRLVGELPPQRPNTLLGQHKLLAAELQQAAATPREAGSLPELRATTLVDTVGPGPVSMPSRVATAPPDPRVRAIQTLERTLPGEAPSPLARPVPEPGIGYSSTLPGEDVIPGPPPRGRIHSVPATPPAAAAGLAESFTEPLGFAHAKTAPPPSAAAPAGAPYGFEGPRGRIVLDEEDRVPAREPAADSIDAPIDAAIEAAKRGSIATAGLMHFGEGALLRIAALFPGELDVLRRDLDSLPPLSAHGPLIRVVLQIGTAMTPHLLELTDHPNASVRFYAAFVFQEIRDDRCMMALSELAFDLDNDVRSISMRVLETYGRSPGFADAVAHVRRELASPNRTRQLHAARAVGTLRDIHSVPTLIELLASNDRYTQESALESLCSITGQQLGLKPSRWRAWYAEHGKRHRVEWIMSSLDHRDVSVRRWAADELSRITGQAIPFPAAGDRADRDAAIRAWIAWWNRSGRERSTGAH